MRARWTTLGAVCSLLAIAGCRPQGVTFEQFVNTTVELRQAARQATTPAAFAARKRAIEARHHVTDADLNRFVHQHATDVKLLSAAWDSVEARLGRAGVRDATTRPTPAPAGPPAAPGSTPATAPGSPPAASPSTTPATTPATPPAPAPPRARVRF